MSTRGASARAAPAPATAMVPKAAVDESELEDVAVHGCSLPWFGAATERVGWVVWRVLGGASPEYAGARQMVEA